MTPQTFQLAEAEQYIERLEASNQKLQSALASARHYIGLLRQEVGPEDTGSRDPTLDEWDEEARTALEKARKV